jgi:hypothetical protein
MVMVAVVAARTGLFQFAPPLLCLAAAFAMLVHCLAQVIFRSLDLVPAALGIGRHGRQDAEEHKNG